MKCVSACFFSFSFHIKCLSALIAGGKADIKIGLLESFSVPFVTLPLEPNCMSLSPLMPASGRQTTGHFPMICFSCQGSDQAWLMDGCPAVGNVSTGPLRKYAFAVFSGWHLVPENKKHGKQRVGFCPSWKFRVSKIILSYLVWETVLQIGLSFPLLLTHQWLDEIMWAGGTWRPRFCYFSVSDSSFSSLIFVLLQKGDDSECSLRLICSTRKEWMKCAARGVISEGRSCSLGEESSMSLAKARDLCEVD